MEDLEDVGGEEIHDTESTAEQIEAAREQGWRDDPDHPKYKPAWKFLEDGEKIAPIAAKQNEKLVAEIRKMKDAHSQELQALRGEIFSQLRKGEESGYKKAMAEIKKKQREAVADGDVEEFERLEQEMESLPKPEAPKQEPVKQENWEFIEWRKDNTWYMNNTDPDDMAKTAYADAILKDVEREVVAKLGASATNTAVYEEIAKRVNKRFNGNATPAPSIEGDAPHSRARGGKQDWSSLPKDAKDYYHGSKVIQNTFRNDKEAYAKSYFDEYGE